MTEYLETWRRSLEDRGMRISRPKTQFIAYKFGQDNGQGRKTVNILGEELQRVHPFKSLGASVEETGGMLEGLQKFHRERVQHGETGRDAVECCVKGGCQ